MYSKQGSIEISTSQNNLHYLIKIKESVSMNNSTRA